MATKNNAPSLAALYTTTGGRLEALRKERGYTQGDLAEALDVTKATISRYESNLIDIPRPKLQKLADFFNVSPAFLMCWANKEDGSDLFSSKEPVFKSAPANTDLDESVHIDYSGLRPRLTLHEPTARQEAELLAIFRSLSVRGQTQLLSEAYKLQDQEEGLTFEKLTGVEPFSRDKLAAFIEQITAEPELQQEIEQKKKQIEELAQRLKEARAKKDNAG